MKRFLVSIILFTSCCLYTIKAQPINDNCINAIDISEAFNGVCGDLNTLGPFDNTNATHSSGDPMVPDCFLDRNPPTNATTMERSLWFKFTVPDVFGNGNEVRFDITASANNSCALENGSISGASDTQMVIYNAIFGCPGPTTLSSTYIACNDDIAPLFVASVKLSLRPGQTYFVLVDTNNGNEGEFCLDIAVCGSICGDGNCAPNERYCTCTQDCVCSALLPQFLCAFQEDIFAFCGTNLVGDFIYCDTYFNDAPADHLYIGFAVTSNGDCQNRTIDKAIINYSDAKLYNADYQFMASGTEISLSTPYYFELSPTDLNNQLVIDVIANTRLENGKNCVVPFEINTQEILSLNTINCGSCVAGNVASNLNNQTVGEADMIEVCTDFTENLNITCDSNDGDGFEYRWVAYADLDGDNHFTTAVTEPLEVGPCDLLPVTFLRDWFDIFPEGDFEILPPGEYDICGLSVCDNTDGSIVKSCQTKQCIRVTLIGNAIKGCNDANACNYNEQATQNDGTCRLVADACDDNNINTQNDVINENCICKGITIVNTIQGCTQICFAEYNPNANQDDGSCLTDLTACTDANAANFDPNAKEDCANANQCIFTDTDGDTIPDYREDLNGNNILEDDDTDADGIPNFMDDDDDGDTILTQNEDTNGNGNLNDDDADGDGIPNYLDLMAVGINNYLNTTLIKPNPNNGLFTIPKTWLNKPLKIYNPLGQSVPFTKKQDATIELRNLNTGLYFIHLVEEGTYHKLMIEK